ncbi:hypothetical protein NOK12_39370 [Nocardioides sp. OK12]|nr:hypothetical protein NOK12_39370 [Nocardioides sp. OK12]
MAENTLVDYTAWLTAWNELIDTVGKGQQAISVIVRASQPMPEEWAEFQTFAGRIMRAKENAEKRRERTQKGGCMSKHAGVDVDRSADGRPHRKVVPERPIRPRFRDAQT